MEHYADDSTDLHCLTMIVKITLTQLIPQWPFKMPTSRIDVRKGS